MLLRRFSKVPQACPLLRLRPRALLMASIQTHSWSSLPTLRAGVQAGVLTNQQPELQPSSLYFTFGFQGRLSREWSVFPALGGWCLPESIFRSACLEGAVLAMTWRTCRKQALFKSIAAVPKQSVYRVIICHLLEYVCSSSLPVFFGALSNWTGSQSAICGLAAMTM